MLEMMMLLGTGLVCAATIGLSGIIGADQGQADLLGPDTGAEVLASASPGLGLNGRRSFLNSFRADIGDRETRAEDGLTSDCGAPQAGETRNDDTFVDEAETGEKFVALDESALSPEDPSQSQPVVVEDFDAGNEMLELLLPEDFPEEFSVTISPTGEQGQDAEVTLSASDQTLKAAIVLGAFGKISLQDFVATRDV